MFLNQSPASREQLTDLVRTLRMTEADVVAFAIQQLFDERVARSTAKAAESAPHPKNTRRKLLHAV
jgi:hypothetical protein